MAGKSIVSEVEKYLIPIVSEFEFELFDIEFLKEGMNWVLRVFIDKEGGIAIDDCELVSRKLEAILDEKDIIQQAYMLEVSSPGIDRPLKKDSHYEKYKGEIVDVKLYKPLHNTKEYQGKLLGLQDDCILIEDENGNSIPFKRSDVAICRLAVFF